MQELLPKAGLSSLVGQDMEEKQRLEARGPWGTGANRDMIMDQSIKHWSDVKTLKLRTV